MTETAATQRRDALLDLVGLRTDVSLAAKSLRDLPWDSQVDLVLLCREDVRRVLELFRNGRLSEADVELWAESIEGREDIGLEVGHEKMLGQFLFEAANPELSRPLQQICSDWLD